MAGRDLIWSVAFLVDERHIVNGGKEGKIRRWRVEDGKEVGVPTPDARQTLLLTHRLSAKLLVLLPPTKDYGPLISTSNTVERHSLIVVNKKQTHHTLPRWRLQISRAAVRSSTCTKKRYGFWLEVEVRRAKIVVHSADAFDLDQA